jgi:hypothetical protein
MTFPRLVVEDLYGGVALPEKIDDQALLCGPGTPSGQKGISRLSSLGFSSGMALVYFTSNAPSRAPFVITEWCRAVHRGLSVRFSERPLVQSSAHAVLAGRRRPSFRQF